MLNGKSKEKLPGKWFQDSAYLARQGGLLEKNLPLKKHDGICVNYFLIFQKSDLKTPLRGSQNGEWGSDIWQQIPKQSRFFAGDISDTILFQFVDCGSVELTKKI